MKTKTTAKIATLVSAFSIVLFGSGALASNQSQLSQAISEGTKAIDIVDNSNVTVGSPTVAFSATAFSFNTQDTTGTLGIATQKIRVSNPTSTATWTASIAASAPTVAWNSGSNNYDFNDPGGYIDQVAGGDADAYGGQLAVSPIGGALAGVPGCATTNVSLGSNSAFVQGTTDSITVASGAAGAAAFCRWDITNVGLTQKVPASQAAGSYSLNLVLSII